MFLATPNEGGGAVVDQAAVDAAASSAAGAATAVDYKALLLSILGLDAAADDAAIQAKATEVQGTLGGVGDLQTKASKAEDLQRQFDELQLKWQDLNKQQEDLYRQKQEAEADEILAAYEDRFVSKEAMAPFRQILISDKQAGIAMLNALKKPDAAAPSEPGDETKGAPPKPKHDPAAAAASGPSEEEIAQKTRVRAAELGKKFPNKNNADLWTQAEKEIRAELAAGKAA
jgi:hypothetical protein